MRIFQKPLSNGNRYLDLLTGGLGALGVEASEFSLGRLYGDSFELWHLHWPEYCLTHRRQFQVLSRVGHLLLSLELAKRRGLRIVWTVHNIRPHERYYVRIENIFYRLFIGYVDGCIFTNMTSRALALEAYPRLAGIPGTVIPLGHYRGAYPDTVTRDEARERLGLGPGETVFLFLGLIRGYKNIPHLIETFHVHADPDARLLIAGRPDRAGLVEEIRTLTRDSPRISLHLGFIPDEQIQVYLRACDVVVLPFSDILNSSSALLALSFDRPVVVPDKGAMGELCAAVGDRWVMLYKDGLTADVLERAGRWATAPRSPAVPDLDDLGWPRIAKQTVDFYQSLCAR